MSRKCRPLCNLSSTTSSHSSSSCIPLHSAVLIDTEKGRRKGLIWLPAPVTCQLSSFFPFLSLVRHFCVPSPFFSPPALLFLSVSSSSRSLSLPLLHLNTIPFPTECLCCFLPSSSLLVWLFTSPRYLPPPPLPLPLPAVFSLHWLFSSAPHSGASSPVAK